MNRGFILCKVILSRLILTFASVFFVLQSDLGYAKDADDKEKNNAVPVIIDCPNNIFLNISGCSTTVSWTPPTSSDPAVTFESDAIPNVTEFPLGSSTVTYTAINTAGETSTCSFTITIRSSDIFGFSVPSDISFAANEGCYRFASWVEPSSTCSGITVIPTTSFSPGSQFPVGETTIVEYIALAGTTFIGQCSFSVTVIDNILPSFTNCPTDMTVAANNNCQAVVSWTPPTASDNCTTAVTPTVSHTSGSTFDIGSTLVTYTVMDASGNSASCTFTVTVEDQTGPVYTNLPEDMEVVVTANSCKAMVSWPTVIAEDNCVGAIDIQKTHNNGGNFNLGLNTVIYTAIDAAGNSNIKSFNINVVDGTPPTVSNCPTTINLDAGSNCNVAATWTPPTFNDKCDASLTITSSHVSGAVFNVGTTRVTYTATDDAGNETICTFDVIVSDVTAPIFNTCPTDRVINTADNCSAVASWTLPTVSDNCDSQSELTSNYNPGDVFNTGETTVTYTATDAAGNTATCDFTITVVDNTAPVFTACPTTIELNANGNCEAVANWTPPTVDDNCTTNPSLTASHSSGSTFPIGISIVTYSSTDEAGNTGTCSFEIIVNDVNAPSFSNCPSDITLTADNNCSAIAIWPDPIISENCSNSPIVNQSATSGSRFSIGATTVTYTAIDDFGNESICDFVVNVIDNSPPTLTNCPSNINMSVGANSCSVNPNWAIPTFTDNCTSPLIISSTHSPGDPFFIGTTTVIYTAEDATGNKTNCSFEVVVTDAVEPVFSSCPGNINLTAGEEGCEAIANWNTPIATDNCADEVTINASHNSGDTFPVGNTTVSYTAIDASGNQSICSFNINVRDLSPPTVVNCTNDVVLSANENCQAIGDWPIPTFEDCSSLSISSNYAVGDLFELGTTEVIYTATDESGRTSSCSFSVTVIDETGPIINNCPNDQTLIVSELCNTIVSWEAPQAADNCSGSVIIESNYQPGDVFEIGETEINYLFTDQEGNSTSCSFMVTVLDESIFEIENCPEDIQVETDESGRATVSWIPPTYLSNECTDVTTSANYQPGDTFDEGETTVKYEFTDENGRLRVCSFLVNVGIRTLAVQASDLLSPNNDGINDYWIIEGLQNFPDNEVIIVDKWGGLIFKATAYDNLNVVWDGTNRSGELVAKGTYFYAINVKTNSAALEKKGFIEIVH